MKKGGSRDGDSKSRDGRKITKGGKGGKINKDGTLHYDRLTGDEEFPAVLDEKDPNYVHNEDTSLEIDDKAKPPVVKEEAGSPVPSKEKQTEAKEETAISKDKGAVAKPGKHVKGAIEKLVLATGDDGKKYIQYGFIRCSPGSDILANQQIFFHMSEVSDARAVARGQQVSFEATKDENWGGRDKYKATKIKIEDKKSAGRRRPSRPRPPKIDTPRIQGSGRSPKSAPTATIERKNSRTEVVFPRQRWRPYGSRDSSPKTPQESGSPKSPGSPVVRYAKGPEKKNPGFQLKRSVSSS